jgi:hypothetical protein
VTALASFRPPAEQLQECISRIKAELEHEIASNLYRFDGRTFDQIGVCVKPSLAEPHYRSPFPAPPQLSEGRPQRLSSATVQALAGSPA